MYLMSTEMSHGELVWTQIPSQDVYRIWHAVEKWLHDACERGRRYTANDVRYLIENDKWQLWVAVDTELLCVCVTELLQYPRKKVLKVIILTGKKRRKWQEIYKEKLEAFAKAEGCQGVESQARKGWARIFPDYKLTHVLLEKEF